MLCRNLQTSTLARLKTVPAYLGICSAILFAVFSLSISPLAHSREFLVESNQHIVLQKLSNQEQELLEKLPSDSLNKVITVELLDDHQNNQGQVWGKVSQKDDRLVFTPRFPFDTKQHYRATYQLKSPDYTALLNHHFSFANQKQQAQTTVSQVFPSADVLPENLFKFYIHFSQAMSRGQAYQHISLLDENQNKVDLPFLELSQELWDPSGQRFTLLFDPGRTKQGIKPNRDMGLPLQQGKQFTLLIDKQWQDAKGLPLKQGFKKIFTVAKQDNTQPNIKNWKVNVPTVNSLEPLLVEFDEPLDRAQLENAVWLENSHGELVQGTLTINNELTWQLKPTLPWKEMEYELVAKSYLEDQAANSLGRAFEVIRGEHDPVIADTISRPVRLSK